MQESVKISVVDGQGGGIGKNIVSKLRKLISKELGVTIFALGTNSTATNNMLKAGADMGATGENAIVQTAAKSNVIIGSIAIIAANSMHGELTPNMALAISSSDAYKVLIPLNRCKIIIPIEQSKTTDSYIESAVIMALELINT